MNFKITENELSLSQIMLTSFKIFFKNIVLISIVILIIFTPICIVNALISIQQWDILESLGDTEQMLNLLYSSDQATLEKVSSVMITIAQKGVILLLIMSFFEPLAKMGVAYITKQEIFAIIPTLNLVIEKTFSKWKTSFITTTFYIFMMLTGCMLFLLPIMLLGNAFFIFIPITFFNIIFYFYSFAIIISNKKEIESLKYSFLLIRKRLSKAFIFIGVFSIPKYLIYFLVSMLVNILIPDSNASFVLFFIQNIIASLLCSYFYVCIAVWYLNLEYIENGGVYFDKSA